MGYQRLETLSSFIYLFMISRRIHDAYAASKSLTVHLLTTIYKVEKGLAAARLGSLCVACYCSVREFSWYQR